MGSGRTLTIGLDGADGALAADLERLARQRGGVAALSDVLELCGRAEDVRVAMTGVSRPRSGVALIGRSVEVGGTVLRSVSLGGTIALRQLVTWAEVMDQEAYDILEAWIYAHSWSMAALSRLTDPAAGAEIIREWGPRLTCTIDELRAAVEAVRGEPARAESGSGGEDGSGADAARVLDSLMVRYGGSECRWLETPVERINALTRGAAANERAREAAIAKGTGSLPPALHDERVNAVAAYARTRERLMSEGGRD